MEMKPEYVIVLATEKRDASGHFPDFEQDKQDPTKKIYLGGEVRMRAALEASKRYPDALFVMVGGFSEENNEVSLKARDMAEFLRENNRSLKLEVISSLPSTKGNLAALFNFLSEKIKDGNFVIVSNDYHIERITEFWRLIKRDSYPNLPEPKFLTVKQLGLEEAAAENSEEYKLRIKREREGIEALKVGEYKNRELERLGVVNLTGPLDNIKLK